MNALLVFDSEFMLSVLAGGNGTIYDRHSFYSNVEGEVSKSSPTEESHKRRMCSERGGKERGLKEQDRRVADWDKTAD